MQQMETQKKKKKRPASPKMLAHLKRLHKLIRARTIARRMAAEGKREAARARYRAKKGSAAA